MVSNVRAIGQLSPGAGQEERGSSSPVMWIPAVVVMARSVADINPYKSGVLGCLAMFELSQRRRDASPSLVLVIVCAGVVLASLDLFIVNLAMPSMARDLHQHDLSTLSWVLNGYAIVYAALLVLLGRLSEARERQNGFLAGALLFTLASAACGAATSLGMLLACRVVQALGAALLTPASLSVVLATTAPERRPGAVRAWT